MRLLRWLADLGLSLMLIGLLSVAAAVVVIPAVTETRPIYVTANSMQNVLPLGSLAYIEPVAQPAIGDWVTYPRNGTHVTHEVVELAPNPANAERDGQWLQTKGTSNDEPDPYLVHRDDVLGRVVYSTPWAGTALKTISSPIVQVFLGLLALTFWLASRGPSKSLKENRTMDDKRDDEMAKKDDDKLDRKDELETTMAAEDDVEVGAVKRDEPIPTHG
jgi:signal peptidase I